MPAKTQTQTESPQQLQEFLQGIVDGKDNFKIGDPWKYSEDALAVVVPIIRENAPDRDYITMYEVLKDLKMEDTGQIDKVALQNDAGQAVFVRAGTIFEGKTQNRASENSGVFQPGKEDVNVRCVHQTHGIDPGSEMKFGDIAPMSVTQELISQQGQSAVWESVQNYTSGQKKSGHRSRTRSYETTFERSQRSHTVSSSRSPRRTGFSSHINHDSRSNDEYFCGFTTLGASFDSNQGTAPNTRNSDDLLGHLKAKNEASSLLNEMMQKVPLFDFQAGAIIFNPVGIMAVETFDHPKSWEAIKKEVIEKHGDKIMEKQANHLFELKPERILPALKEFIEKLIAFREQTIRKDGFSETRIIVGDNIVGEYTLVDNKVIHTILARET